MLDCVKIMRENLHALFSRNPTLGDYTGKEERDSEEAEINNTFQELDCEFWELAEV